MKIAIMQPYFFPYIGYFQLIEAVDLFVVYDNIKYTKKGWINRNRFLRNGEECVFTVPLRKDSDALDVRDRAVAADFDRDKLVNQLREAYRKAPHFQDAFPIVEATIRSPEENLFEYIRGAIGSTCDYLEIDTRVVPSSSISIDHSLRGKEKVLAICKAVGAKVYINSIGGTGLYSKDDFQMSGIELRFIRSLPVEYRQFQEPFIPWLSIIDVMMFNPRPTIRGFLETQYEFE